MKNSNNCVGSYSVSGYTRADGTEVSGYTRTCGAAHSSQDDTAKLQNRANLLYNNMENKRDDVMTGGAAKLTNKDRLNNNNSNQTIAGVERGEPMTFEEAGAGVNPNYNYQVRNDYTTNCQSSVAVFEARLRGYDIETKMTKSFDERELLSKLKENPNMAYIDPKTGKTPYFTTIKAKNAEELEQWLNNNLSENQRYLFTYKSILNKSYNSGSGHILEVMKDNANNIKFYDPQINKTSNKELIKRIQFNFNWNEPNMPPQILRVDDKELNHKVLSAISKPRKKLLGE